MLTSVFRPRQGKRAFFLFFTLPWASGLLSPPRGRDFVCSYLSSLFAIGQAKRKSILHFVKLGIRFSNLRNFFLLRAVGDSIRLHICAREYSSEYLSGANILRLRRHVDGVEELIIVQTEDATLIMRRGQSQKERDVLNALLCLAKSYRQKSAYRGTDRSPCSRPKFFWETRMAYEGLYRSRYKARLRDRVWSDALISTGMTISACWSKKSTSAVPFDSQ